MADRPTILIAPDSGPAQTRTLDEGDPSSALEWDAYWRMIGAWRAAIEHIRDICRHEADGERPLSAVGALLGDATA